MLITLRTRQLIGVAAIVLLATVLVGTVHLLSLVRVVLADAQAQGELLARAVYQRAREVVTNEAEAHDALRRDRGLRSLLESSIAYGRGVTYAVIVDTDDTILLHSFPSTEGARHVADERLAGVIAGGAIEQVRAIYGDGTYTVDEPLMLGDAPFGTIRIGLSTVLIRQELTRALRPAGLATIAALALALALAAALSPWILKPIHALRDGHHVDHERDEADDALRDPGRGDETPPLESARRWAALGRPLAGVAHEVKNPLHAMTIHLELLRQKLAGLARPADASAGSSILGIADLTGDGEPRNEPNGLGDRDADLRSAREHVDVLDEEIKRLDEVIQGVVRFIRPPELHPEPLAIGELVREVLALIAPDAERAGVTIEIDCPPTLPAVAADRALMRQALLNLALNGCQAMPTGGLLRIRARAAAGRRVTVTVEDTGHGIAPEQLDRIFDLYYTSREHGSGIGLAMVYKAVQLHGGEIDVESTAGVGSRFRLSLPQAYNIVT